jgi:hypothetical protein
MIWCLIFVLVGAVIWLIAPGKAGETGRMTLQIGLFWLLYMLATGHSTVLRIG